jgi:hypothetical protein
VIISLVGLAAILLAPPFISIAYVFVWPRLLRRRALVSIAGSVTGLIFAFVALSWVTLPLQYIGVSGSSNPGPSIDEMIVPRELAALLCVAIATAGSLWVVTRVTRRGSAS